MLRSLQCVLLLLLLLLLLLSTAGADQVGDTALSSCTILQMWGALRQLQRVVAVHRCSTEK